MFPPKSENGYPIFASECCFFIKIITIKKSTLYTNLVKVEKEENADEGSDLISVVHVVWNWMVLWPS